MSFRSAFIGFMGAIVGGAVVWLGQTGSFHLRPVGMSYAELAAVLLTAVGVIVAIFGGVLALAAVWGFNQLKRDAISAAETAGSAEIKVQIGTGALRDYIKGEIERLTDEEFESERMDKRINSRVDAVAFGRPADDRLLDDEENES
ncbi:hypothetical protein [Magnetospirillum sulfuroxidans]|uniref:Lipopolysaccharide assembly protein A domain-containing protein n=1 Tax=Magnetospirillum sulfuroxidans TaxID=611300 RepID=A0ABS5IEI4_9PROT|nr:hypothetical protein [Magnetospirillum sulfuroxidans]MBR9972691.1 hypothetical protein [Magnetospirillum sulfuroxidans]